MAFEDLYQEIILDHFRNPHNAEPLDHLPAERVHENPSCGDSIKLQVFVNERGNIEKIVFDGRGCAISVASASIMTELLNGKNLRQAQKQVDAFFQVMRGMKPAELLDDMGELVCLKGVINYPMRIKCATLAWHAAEESLGECLGERLGENLERRLPSQSALPSAASSTTQSLKQQEHSNAQP